MNQIKSSNLSNQSLNLSSLHSSIDRLSELIQNLFASLSKRSLYIPNNYQPLLVSLLLVLCTVIRISDACKARSTPKPRPPLPEIRPNITFQTYQCPEAYAKWYCLNGATYFFVRIGESILYNCECADGYMGQRCEFKVLEGLVHNACKARSTPKPRPPLPEIRPNITFQTYQCPEAYAKWYCLNGATYFFVRIGESILYNCECADGYMGQRCEFKVLEGSYLQSREKVFVETAKVAGRAFTLLVLFVFVALIFFQNYNHSKRKSGTNHQQTSQLPFIT